MTLRTAKIQQSIRFFLQVFQNPPVQAVRVTTISAIEKGRRRNQEVNRRGNGLLQAIGLVVEEQDNFMTHSKLTTLVSGLFSSGSPASHASESGRPKQDSKENTFSSSSLG